MKSIAEHFDTGGPHRPSIHTTLRRLANWGVVVVAVVVAAAALRAGAVVVLPVVLALWLAMLLWPLHTGVRRVMPDYLAAIVPTILVVVVLAFVAWFGWYGAQQVVEQFRGAQSTLMDDYRGARTWLTEHGVPSAWLPAYSGGDAASFGPSAGADGSGGEAVDGQTIVAKLPGGARERLVTMLVGGVGSALGALVTIVLTVFLMYLVLGEARRWREWMDRQLRPHRRNAVEALVRDFAGKTRAYFVAKTITGVVSGGATAIWLWFMDIPLPVVWGALTWALNYIPNVGGFLSGIPPTLLALLTADFGTAAIVAGGLLVIETLIGNLLDPLVLGDALALSPFFVLVSLVFWGWLWGVAGAVLGPTITAGLIMVADRLRIGHDPGRTDGRHERPIRASAPTRPAADPGPRR